jgi:5-methylcytosine-specific restriction enzyme A
MPDPKTTRTRGRAWQRIRDRVLSLNPLCVRCTGAGLVTLAREVDHIKPLHKGGTDDPANLAGLCLDCHRDKTASDMGHRVKVWTGADGWPVE